MATNHEVGSSNLSGHVHRVGFRDMSPGGFFVQRTIGVRFGERLRNKSEHDFRICCALREEPAYFTWMMYA
jgi:hypothetical protein